MDNFRNGFTKALVGFFGWLVILAGIVLLPLPGPGWLTIFVGLSILAKQYKWARKLRVQVHQKYDVWRAWIARQPIAIKMLFWIMTVLTVVVSLWLLNAYAIVATILSLDKDWLSSPFLRSR